jgi:malate dehydrogenase (quinone)
VAGRAARADHQARPDKGGVLKPDTEILAFRDGSIAGLPGASSGASTAAPIMLNLLNRVFKDKMAAPAWQSEIRQIVPGYGTRLHNGPARLVEAWRLTAETQGSNQSPVPRPQTTPGDMAL